ncbi:MAG: hypothetical protein AABZ14_07660 [Candidatus Margulisiibacteriota bacterium]
MVEIGSDFHHVSQASSIPPRVPHSQAGYYGEPIISCDDCPSSKVCKKIGNYRKSCEPGKIPSPGELSVAKCLAGTNILLAKLLERMGGQPIL